MEIETTLEALQALKTFVILTDQELKRLNGRLAALEAMVDDVGNVATEAPLDDRSVLLEKEHLGTKALYAMSATKAEYAPLNDCTVLTTQHNGLTSEKLNDCPVVRTAAGVCGDKVNIVKQATEAAEGEKGANAQRFEVDYTKLDVHTDGVR